MTRLKDIAILNREVLPESTEAGHTFRYVDIGSVDRIGRITGVEVLRFEDAPSRARRLVQPGDSILSTVRTYLRAIAHIEHDAEDLVVSTGFATVTPRPDVHPRFLFWTIRSDVFIEDVVARSVGVSYPAITATELGTLQTPLPPLEDQRRTADFLDAETTRIDDLIAEQENFKTLLAERLAASRQVLLLGPEGTGMPGWDYGRLKRFVHIARGRFTHRPRNDPALYDGPYPFIQTGDIAAAPSGVIETWSQTLNERGLAASRLAPAGTLVMAIAANIGDVARLGFDACFPDSVVAVSPRSDVTIDYLLEILRAARQQLIGSSTLNTQLNINVDRIGDLEVPVPPLREQIRLVGELGRMASEVATAALEVDHQERLLLEHRQALVTAAVSGQLDPRKGVA